MYLYLVCMYYVHCTYLTTLCRSCGGKLELYACQQKKPYHLLHIYCTTTTITVPAMVSISIKNGALNLWDWFLLFMNCLLRMT